MMKARWARVPNKGSTAIFDRGRKPDAARGFGCDDGLDAAGGD